MITMLQVKVDAHHRTEMQAVLKSLGCEIEEQGWVDGSTAWGFVIACFIDHVTADSFRLPVRDAKFNHWFVVESI